MNKTYISGPISYYILQWNNINILHNAIKDRRIKNLHWDLDDIHDPFSLLWLLSLEELFYDCLIKDKQCKYSPNVHIHYTDPRQYNIPTALYSVEDSNIYLL